MRLGEIRGEIDGFLPRSSSIVPPILSGIGNSKVEVRLIIIGSKLDGPFVLGDGRDEIALVVTGAT